MKKAVKTRALNKAKILNKVVNIWSGGILFKVYPSGKIVSFY